MGTYKYDILDDNGRVVAENIDITEALVFVKALFEEYWQEPGLGYKIERRSEN